MVLSYETGHWHCYVLRRIRLTGAVVCARCACALYTLIPFHFMHRTLFPMRFFFLFDLNDDNKVAELTCTVHTLHTDRMGSLLDFYVGRVGDNILERHSPMTLFDEKYGQAFQ